MDHNTGAYDRFGPRDQRNSHIYGYGGYEEHGDHHNSRNLLPETSMIPPQRNSNGYSQDYLKHSMSLERRSTAQRDNGLYQNPRKPKAFSHYAEEEDMYDMGYAEDYSHFRQSRTLPVHLTRQFQNHPPESVHVRQSSQISNYSTSMFETNTRTSHHRDSPASLTGSSQFASPKQPKKKSWLGSLLTGSSKPDKEKEQLLMKQKALRALQKTKAGASSGSSSNLKSPITPQGSSDLASYYTMATMDSEESSKVHNAPRTPKMPNEVSQYSSRMGENGRSGGFRSRSIGNDYEQMEESPRGGKGVRGQWKGYQTRNITGPGWRRDGSYSEDVYEEEDVRVLQQMHNDKKSRQEAENSRVQMMKRQVSYEMEYEDDVDDEEEEEQVVGDRRGRGYDRKEESAGRNSRIVPRSQSTEYLGQRAQEEEEEEEEEEVVQGLQRVDTFHGAMQQRGEEAEEKEEVGRSMEPIAVDALRNKDQHTDSEEEEEEVEAPAFKRVDTLRGGHGVGDSEEEEEEDEEEDELIAAFERSGTMSHNSSGQFGAVDRTTVGKEDEEEDAEDDEEEEEVRGAWALQKTRTMSRHSSGNFGVLKKGERESDSDKEEEEDHHDVEDEAPLLERTETFKQGCKRDPDLLVSDEEDEEEEEEERMRRGRLPGLGRVRSFGRGEIKSLDGSISEKHFTSSSEGDGVDEGGRLGPEHATYGPSSSGNVSNSQSAFVDTPGKTESDDEDILVCSAWGNGEAESMRLNDASASSQDLVTQMAETKGGKEK